MFLIIPCLSVLSLRLLGHAQSSFLSGETTGQSAWNPLIWPMHFVIFVSFFILFLQVVAECLKAIISIKENKEKILQIYLLMFPALFFLNFFGFPVAFSLIGSAFIFGIFTFGDAVFFQFISKIEGIDLYGILAAVPLFVFMGSMLERSGIAQQLFSAIHMWTRRLPGGLAIGAIIMCIIFAASTGVIGATESVVGLLAIPAMLKHKYSHSLISGTICAGGSLGTIIPPSVVVVVLGPIADVSIGDLMVGMIFPGLILATLYIIYIVILCILRPENGPTITEEDEIDKLSFNQKIFITFKALVPPLVNDIFGIRIDNVGVGSTHGGCCIRGSRSIDFKSVIYKKFTLKTFKEALIKTITSHCNDNVYINGWQFVYRSFCGNRRNVLNEGNSKFI